MAKKKEKLIQEQGCCPKCGCDNLEYGSSEPDGESYYYEFTCNECGTFGKEWYNLTYSETIVEGQDEV